MPILQPRITVQINLTSGKVKLIDGSIEATLRSSEHSASQSSLEDGHIYTISSDGLSNDNDA